jgi:hypothetical protein
MICSRPAGSRFSTAMSLASWPGSGGVSYEAEMGSYIRAMALPSSQCMNQEPSFLPLGEVLIITL